MAGRHAGGGGGGGRGKAHLLEGVFKQRLPGYVDLDVAGQSVGLWGEGKDGGQS